MPENKNFRLRPKADKDLENIHDYSFQEFGNARADQYIRDLDAAFHKLAGEPSLGNNYNHVRSDLMAYRVVSHVVFFKPLPPKLGRTERPKFALVRLLIPATGSYQGFSPPEEANMQLASKTDSANLKTDIIKWNTGTLLAATGLFALIVKLIS